MLLKIHDLCAFTRLSRASVYHSIKAGKLPPPHTLTSRTSRWHLLVVGVARRRGGVTV
jgi:predicted DNA-binding transcriptional regulator AlpA